jgi:hypothetical protein
MRLLISLLALTGLLGATGPEAPQSAHPVVVELFTSQGCSSCPPADALAELLSQRPDLVVLTRPVTIWDRLGWKDTLAREENTSLQRAYAAHGGEGSGVYTPQTVVQGRYPAVGSDRTQIGRQIAAARASITAAIAERSGVIGVAGEGGPADVKLLALKSSQPVRIGSGENGGRMIRYSNIVIAERLLGRWQGGAASFKLPEGFVQGADKWAVVVQSPKAGPIFAATYLQADQTYSAN